MVETGIVSTISINFCTSERVFTFTKFQMAQTEFLGKCVISVNYNIIYPQIFPLKAQDSTSQHCL